eukprot:TRINITY_DN93105_c0_g1_i1.p2 TRINITY_DN93105_c0_g1~~TRINITY_DN93105_c0_g1_i1.p2  ORF type:complete len:137 (-),score=12.00 TRINITY_DN93105_c0_g1_i1:24-434(-)
MGCCCASAAQQGTVAHPGEMKRSLLLSSHEMTVSENTHGLPPRGVVKAAVPEGWSVETWRHVRATSSNERRVVRWLIWLSRHQRSPIPAEFLESVVTYFVAGRLQLTIYSWLSKIEMPPLDDAPVAVIADAGDSDA